MGMLFSGTQANVALSGSLTLTKSTAAMLCASRWGAGSTTIGTVTAGKVWRIIGMTVHGNMATNATEDVSIDIDGTPVMKVLISSLAGQVAGAVAVWNGNYYDAIPVAAGKVIRITTGASGNGAATITYIEEAA